jgi:hypothetical protein
MRSHSFQAASEREDEKKAERNDQLAHKSVQQLTKKDEFCSEVARVTIQISLVRQKSESKK